MCSMTWQWNIHLPGLSATKAIFARSFFSSKIVSVWKGVMVFLSDSNTVKINPCRWMGWWCGVALWSSKIYVLPRLKTASGSGKCWWLWSLHARRFINQKLWSTWPWASLGDNAPAHSKTKLSDSAEANWGAGIGLIGRAGMPVFLLIFFAGARSAPLQIIFPANSVDFITSKSSNSWSVQIVRKFN